MAQFVLVLLLLGLPFDLLAVQIEMEQSHSFFFFLVSWSLFHIDKTVVGLEVVFGHLLVAFHHELLPRVRLLVLLELGADDLVEVAHVGVFVVGAVDLAFCGRLRCRLVQIAVSVILAYRGSGRTCSWRSIV